MSCLTARFVSARLVAPGLALLVGLSLCVTSITAQETKTDTKKSDVKAVDTKSAEKAPSSKKKSTKDSSRRLPNDFGNLKLTDEQREEVYKIQAQYEPEIDRLEEELKALRAKQVKEAEKVLSPEQKAVLEQIRALNKSKSKAAADEKESQSESSSSEKTSTQKK